jgi:hypothetical protein
MRSLRRLIIVLAEIVQVLGGGPRSPDCFRPWPSHGHRSVRARNRCRHGSGGVRRLCHFCNGRRAGLCVCSDRGEHQGGRALLHGQKEKSGRNRSCHEAIQRLAAIVQGSVCVSSPPRRRAAVMLRVHRRSSRFALSALRQCRSSRVQAGPRGHEAGCRPALRY